MTNSGSRSPSPDTVELRAALDDKRHHILHIADALDDDQLRAAILPSGWTPIELVRHLTIGDERYWISCIVGGADLDRLPIGPRADWSVEATTPPRSVIDDYRTEIDTSNRILDAVSLDDPPRQRDAKWNEWGVEFPTIRRVVLHLLCETAVHAGHLDAVVELIDGRQRLVTD